MGDKMLKNIINMIKNSLLLVLIFLLVTMLFVKSEVYKIKKNIREIDEKILALDKQKEILNLELTFLTRPERLKQIYKAMKDINLKDNEDIVVTNQIKDIKVLIPYYYVKNNTNNSIASR